MVADDMRAELTVWALLVAFVAEGFGEIECDRYCKEVILLGQFQKRPW